ncbi:MAG: hypothetical protein HY473_01045 [Candidatus Sungbacteria bacterium]|uniref:Exonuclease domain-containing protein n=1 Tax=Candidatus Sungiibacteriota bacterium TaxID=2750080 RepID=A0A933DTA3_9BACT|nr:hypothetical protein [Candidatus Sungbacteria bacterium]
MERGWSRPDEFKEIVEIGAIRVDPLSLDELDALTIFAKPEKNPALSEYFIQLTGITQKEVDEKGMSFAEAIAEFAAWAGNCDLYSYGRDDDVLAKNSQFAGIVLPIKQSRFKNIKEIFEAHGIPVENYMSSTIVRAFGKEPERRGHEAVNDARTILDGLRELSKRINVSP